MKSKWRVISNPMAGYIVVRTRNTAEVVHSGNLEYHGNYMDDEAEAQRIADELNEKEGE